MLVPISSLCDCERDLHMKGRRRKRKLWLGKMSFWEVRMHLKYSHSPRYSRLLCCRNKSSTTADSWLPSKFIRLRLFTSLNSSLSKRWSCQCKEQTEKFICNVCVYMLIRVGECEVCQATQNQCIQLASLKMCSSKNSHAIIPNTAPIEQK